LVQVITFDFHNTLANCDPWFELEVRDLPWAVITHLGLNHERISRDDVDRAYRDLRLSIIESGNEIDAYESVALIFRQFEVEAPPQSIAQSVDTLMLNCLESMVPVPGAVETVRYLHERRIRMGVVSSAVHHQTLEWILERMGILDCFVTVATSASTGFYKSTPAIYHAALGELAARADQSIHIGDSLRWDVETAQKAGMHTVWLRTPRREVFATEQVAITPSATFASLQGAGPVLLSMLEGILVPT
jgi:HAD superfamily hydrolase (TIGR01509 family)